MPARFEFPPGEVESAEVWAPLQLNPANPGNRGGHRFYLLGRLRDGVSLSQARQELDAYVAEQDKLGPGSHHFSKQNHTLITYPLQSEVTGSIRPALWALLGATAFVLLIACGNVANLLLARAEERGREIAVRRAMGATNLELVRQFLIEGLLLAGGGALLGVLFAQGALRLILAAAEGSIPRSGEINVDGMVLLFACLLAVGTGVFFGLSPLAQLLPRSSAELLRSGTRSTATREAHWLRGALITAEMAMALVLLIGSGLMVAAFWKLQQVETGLRPEGVLTMRLALPAEVYREPGQTMAFWRNLEERLNALPGVVAASVSTGLPPVRPINANDTQVEGYTPKPGGPGHNIDYYNIVGPRYFAAQGIELAEGRLFNESDGSGSPPVLLINESTARLYYEGKSAIGRRMRPSGVPDWMTIVGVVKDVRNAGLDQPAGTELYVVNTQLPTPLRGAWISVRTQGEPAALANAVRNEVRALDASLPVANVRPMTDVLAAAQARPRFLAILLGLFSSVALGLATLGMYSVMSYAVAQRTSEFGIRMAMGAQRRDVLRLVLFRGLSLSAIGLILGAAGAAALNRTAAGVLYGAAEFSVLPVLWMGSVLMGVTLLACLAPALRATRVDPITALRYE
jgi:predicted permease